MGKREIIDMALQLKAEDRYEIAESIMQSLDKSDPEIEQAWAEEAHRRACACDDGLMKLLPAEDILGDD
ncbi:conserved protein of unknown function [Sterolibacterium denitrificans]|uniref:Uncharacterized protein n=2 Tax=Sterolibacterium denitrificans TaxID=157592 RepID=A0A7Z7HP95_9PROT|nr:addiction module protein [Sterolibacterium denitrificans]KYC28851.1 hypothetical protein ACY05_04005 [Sterolibacterium denitrificans]SMB21164.1 conserved protein of unknown function [Sterolibacterium denitrificans]